MRVTFTVPCYGHAHLLDESLGSILAQTREDWRAIVVDDAAPDGDEAARKVAGFADERFQLIRQPENRGLAAARNRGFGASSTEVVVCVDADDRIEPRFLEVLLPVLEESPDLDVVYGDVKTFGVMEYRSFLHVPTLQELLHKQPIPGSGALIRKSLWERVGGYDESANMRLGREDWEFWIRAYRQGCRAAHVPEPLYSFRSAASSMSVDCRVQDNEVSRYIYEKHRELFDRTGEANRFLAFGHHRAALASLHGGRRGRALLMALRAATLEPTLQRWGTVLLPLVPARVRRRVLERGWAGTVSLMGHLLRGRERFHPVLLVDVTSDVVRGVGQVPGVDVSNPAFDVAEACRAFLAHRRRDWPDLVDLTVGSVEGADELRGLPASRRNLAFVLDHLLRGQSPSEKSRWALEVEPEPEVLKTLLRAFPDAQVVAGPQAQRRASIAGLPSARRLDVGSSGLSESDLQAFLEHAAAAVASG